jgi:Domain of unknown function (DUF4349)
MRSPFFGRRPGRSASLVLPFLVIAAIAAACGSGASAPYVPAGGAAASAAPAAPAGGTANDGETTGNGSNQGSGNGSGGAGNPGDQVAVFEDQKIVRTGSLQMTVKDVTTALTSARDGIRSIGGYIGGSQQERNGDSVVASVTYRIPVTRWEDALDVLRGLGTEVGEKTDAAEITGEIVDLQARIRNLKASEAALVGYAQQAPKVTDLLEVESRLTDTRGQIERLSAQEAQLQDQAAFATLTVTFGTEVVAVTEAAAKWDPASEVDRASATLIAMGQAVLSFAIVFVIVWVPLLLSLGLVAAVGIWIARRLGWRRPDRYPPLSPPPTSAEA